MHIAGRVRSGTAVNIVLVSLLAQKNVDILRNLFCF